MPQAKQFYLHLYGPPHPEAEESVVMEVYNVDQIKSVQPDPENRRYGLFTIDGVADSPIRLNMNAQEFQKQVQWLQTGGSFGYGAGVIAAARVKPDVCKEIS